MSFPNRWSKKKMYYNRDLVTYYCRISLTEIQQLQNHRLACPPVTSKGQLAPWQGFCPREHWVLWIFCRPQDDILTWRSTLQAPGRADGERTSLQSSGCPARGQPPDPSDSWRCHRHRPCSLRVGSTRNVDKVIKPCELAGVIVGRFKTLVQWISTPVLRI